MNRQFINFAFVYAFRSLWRNKRRTLLTMFTVAFSVAVAIVASRYSVAIMKLWQDGAADTGTAHAQLHAVGYFDQPEGVREDLTLVEGSEIESRLTADPRVESVTRRLKLEGLVSVREESLYFMGIGVDGEREMIVSPRLFTKNDVGMFVKSDALGGVVVGEGLAETMKLALGDELTLVTQTVQGSVNGVDGVVRGIVDAGVPSFNKRVIFADLRLLQKLLRMPGRYTELAIRLKPGVDPRRFVADHREAAKSFGAELRGWWEIEPIISNVGRIWDSVVGVIAFLLFVSAGLSVLNIVFMLVAERTVEIGTLMAIGARGQKIRRLFAFEASLIGIIGGGAGVLVGNAVIFGMDRVGVPFRSPFGADLLLVHPKMSLLATVLIFAAGVLICWLASIIPARRAAEVEPVRAFRGQIT
jgi:putative ABC transport system permease protein